MRSPFEEITARVIVSSDRDVEKPFHDNDTSRCKFCGGFTIPIKYLGKIPTYFICTNADCQRTQHNPNHPMFQDVKEEDIQDTDTHDMTNRRSTRGQLSTIKSSTANPEESVIAIKENPKLTAIKRKSITQAEAVNLRESVYEDTAEINIRRPLSPQIEREIYRSLKNLKNTERQKEISDKTLVREMRRNNKVS